MEEMYSDLLCVYTIYSDILLYRRDYVKKKKRNNTEKTKRKKMKMRRSCDLSEKRLDMNTLAILKIQNLHVM